jgi:hypothetical protein
MVKVAIFKKIASVLAIPILVIGILVYHSYRMIYIGNSLSEEYLLIEKKDSINDVIINIYFPDGFKATPSTRLIVLSNGNKRTLFTEEDNVFRSISDVIKIGTRITKQKDSDTVVLTNITAADTSVYYFRIKDSNFK